MGFLKTSVLSGLAIGTTLLLGVSSACAGVVFEQYNGPPGPAPFFWTLDDIGWYWTPGSDVQLEGIQTQLATASNINNNYTFTASVYSDRPDAGGSLVGSFDFNGATPVDGPWVGGSFATPLSLIGGTQYFVAFSGWLQAVTTNGGAGVNWVDPVDAVNYDNFGAGSSWASVGSPGSFNTQLSPNGLGTTDQGIVRFIEVNNSPVIPEPASLALFLTGMLSAAGFRKRISLKA